MKIVLSLEEVHEALQKFLWESRGIQQAFPVEAVKYRWDSIGEEVCEVEVDI